MKLHNVTAGEILKEEFLIPLAINQSSLARSLDCDRSHINHIIKNKTKISKKFDKKLCKFFGLSQGFFLRLQNYERREGIPIIEREANNEKR